MKWGRLQQHIRKIPTTHEARTGEDRWGQVWTGEERSGQVWTGMDRWGQVRTSVDQHGQVRTGMDRWGQVWTGEGRCGQVRTGVDLLAVAALWCSSWSTTVHPPSSALVLVGVSDSAALLLTSLAGLFQLSPLKSHRSISANSSPLKSYRSISALSSQIQQVCFR